MATKDEWYDPKVNFDPSDEEELNNDKYSPGTSPSDHDLGDIFVFNDLGRRGGPQADNGAKASVKQLKECKTPNCPNKVEQRLDGWRFGCSQPEKPRSVKDEAKYKAQHKFCEKCAYEAKCPRCGSPALPAAQGREPRPVD